MQGVFYTRPSGAHDRLPTKKALKDQAKAHPETIVLEATSVFGNEYDGSLTYAPDGEFYVVGPDPRTSRKWYATIVKQGDTIKVS